MVIDTLGGDIFDASIRAMAWCGRIVVVGFAAGRIPEIKANYLLLKNITACGLQITDYQERQPEKVRWAHDAMVALWKKGHLRPKVMRGFALDQFQEAIAVMEARAATGRLVLRMD